MATCLQGRVASATATPSGTGEATAPDLAARGAVVALVARRADRLAAPAARIASAGGTTQVEAGETDQRQVRKVVERTVHA